MKRNHGTRSPEIRNTRTTHASCMLTTGGAPPPKRPSGAARFALAHERLASTDAERSAQLDADPRVMQPDPDEDQRLCGASHGD